MKSSDRASASKRFARSQTGYPHGFLPIGRESLLICPSCGNEFSGAMEFCPVCMLRKGLAGGVESGESSSEVILKPAPEQATQRFEHYERVKGEDGKPVGSEAYKMAAEICILAERKLG